MSYPASITGFYAGFGIGSSPYGQFAFEWGGYQYFFGLKDGGGPLGPAGDDKIHALQSSDAGLTFTELDSANAPAPSLIAGAGGAFYTAIRDEETVIVLWIRYHGTAGAFVIDGVTTETFSLISGTWDATPVNFTSPLPGAPPNAVNTTSVQLLIRGHHDYVLLYQGPRETLAGIHYVRSYYATFDGTTWGTPTVLPDQAGLSIDGFPFGSCVDSNRIVHFGYQVGASGFGAADSHVSLDTSNSFGSVGLISGDDADLASGGAQAQLIIIRDDTPERLGFACQTLDVSFNEAMVFFYADAVLNPPSWTAVTITSDPALQMNIPNAATLEGQPMLVALGCHDANLICVWAVGANPSAAPWWWYCSTTPTSAISWSAPAILTSEPTFTPETGFPVQVCAYESATGVGLILVWDSNFDDLLTQFYLFPFSPTPPSSTSAASVYVLLK